MDYYKKGCVGLIILLVITLIFVLGTYIIKPKYWENLVFDLLNKNKSSNQDIQDNSLPIINSEKSPTKIPTVKTQLTPTISKPPPTPTLQPIINPTSTPSPFPTSSFNFDEEPSKKDKPFIGG
ncbi:hypothetical protein A2Z22_03835 [Candidatus Woesebacteria bacterium RBG_16_34_12]|uniref:Uncharacterized protein n=1 Tax=Candidatus Woesebacteria bacterium RBG_16_34_12 TaxID=1802480 RepID=A0A1F7X7L3_9BACT|nr:MAG: hypothetical protein A2Z22_03835 [Candidatus Woesebacteria bacterium RBG_16_34_12]